MSLKDCYPVFRIGNELAFTFVSRDPEGTNPVMKMITYVLTENKGEPYYNLGFGDCHPESDFPDDEAISNNGDMRKVLRTVISTLVIFFDEYPQETICITGSDSLRHNYYQKIVWDYRHIISQHYIIRGSINDHTEPFQKEKQYDFILITLKK